MAYSLINKCAKNYYNRTFIVPVIAKNVVTCFFETQCSYFCVNCLGLSEPMADNVRAAGTGWFAALMLLLVISLIVVSVVTAIKCRIGAIYPGWFVALLVFIGDSSSRK